MAESRRGWPCWSLAVVASMVLMFVAPSKYFIPAAYFATSVMFVAAWRLGALSGRFKPSVRSIALGLAAAVLLYFIFYAGNAGIAALHPFGVSQSNEGTIYALIASPSNPAWVQVGVLAFDAVGYEAFFRGYLQNGPLARTGRFAPFSSALVDAAIHVTTLNPLWVVTTFIADSVWGVDNRFAKELSSNVVSHFVWDVLIFLLFPIR
ncbi:MAG TPA: CPBP family glutamic-type intramembrane protease [Nitrososphaerales archaeon]|nr:CPBP family glutamic-type intramembrane protease [Nitrososphaerales archaeon]